ncbi:MAG: hypothetical protein GF388_04040 [Candidatus Aegiribacteria sp.]|nr:hypothetical protein [Candidatus Aegiribacteria sp.]MBD3294413.1 hypothetical protein [Candidatus Fermentibacteria bacterium]
MNILGRSFMKHRVSLLQWTLAVIVSLMLWVLSMSKIEFEITDRLPVARPAVPSDYIVLDGFQTDSVRVTFRGSGIGVLTDQIMRDPLSVKVSVPVEETNQDFPVRISRDYSEEDIVFRGQDYSSLSTGSFSPPSISLTIDRSVVREIPVNVVASGEIPQRYYWSSTSPARVEVKGAESVIAGMDSCLTDAVEPNSRNSMTAIVKHEGVVYISPSSVSAELVQPVEVVMPLR